MMKNIDPQDPVWTQNTSELSDSIGLFSYRDMPGETFSLLMGHTSYVMFCIAAFGLTTNILIIITYTKIGFAESINMSYCALGVSDIFCVIFITWHAICSIPAMSVAPFIPREFVVPTGGLTSSNILKTTGWITAFISLERCLCVLFPLKIKTIVGRRRTIVGIIVIYALTIFPLTGVTFYTYLFHSEFDTRKNRTLVRVTFRNSHLSWALTNAVYIYKLVFLNSIPFAVILVSAILLAIRLNRSAEWRMGKTNTGVKQNEVSFSTDEKAAGKIVKEMRIAKTVLTIAITYIFCGSVSTIRYLIALEWPEFNPFGEYANHFKFSSRVELFLSLINSSVNFIIYYNMGTKFRATVRQMVSLNCQR